MWLKAAAGDAFNLDPAIVKRLSVSKGPKGFGIMATERAMIIVDGEKSETSVDVDLAVCATREGAEATIQCIVKALSQGQAMLDISHRVL